MNKILSGTISAVLAVITLGSCSEQKEQNAVSSSSFQTESFNDFLWRKHNEASIEAIINTEFFEFEGITSPLILCLCDDDANPITSDVAQLYVNGKQSVDNTITILPSSSLEKTDIRVVLDDSYIHDTRTFSWNLQVVKNPGFSKINDRIAGKDPWIVDTHIHWKNKYIANSLKVAMDLLLVSILIAMIVWIVLVQFVLFPRFKSTQVNRIFITTGAADRKSIYSYNQSVVGVKEIVISAKDKSRGIIPTLFFGKVAYIKITGLPGNISLLPGSGKYQSSSSYDRKKFTSELSGENGELKLIKSIEGDFYVEYYAKRK